MTQNGEAQEHRQMRMSRQTALVGKEVENLSVLILGVGGIGSNAAHLLVSMGVHDITLLDPDTVEQENLFPAWFAPSLVGEPKVFAVQAMLGEFGVVANAYHATIEEYEPDKDTIYDIILVCTDDIESRAKAFHKLRNHTAWWIDGRMGGMGCDMFCFNLSDVDAVKSYIDELVPFESKLLCGEKATAYNTKGALMMMLGWMIRDISMEEAYPFYMISCIGERNSIISVPTAPESIGEIPVAA